MNWKRFAPPLLFVRWTAACTCTVHGGLLFVPTALARIEYGLCLMSSVPVEPHQKPLPCASRQINLSVKVGGPFISTRGWNLVVAKLKCSHINKRVHTHSIHSLVFTYDPHQNAQTWFVWPLLVVVIDWSGGCSGTFSYHEAHFPNLLLQIVHKLLLPVYTSSTVGLYYFVLISHYSMLSHFSELWNILTFVVHNPVTWITATRKNTSTVQALA